MAGAGPGPRRRRGGEAPLARSNQRATKMHRCRSHLLSGPRKFSAAIYGSCGVRCDEPPRYLTRIGLRRGAPAMTARPEPTEGSGT